MTSKNLQKDLKLSGVIEVEIVLPKMLLAVAAVAACTAKSKYTAKNLFNFRLLKNLAYSNFYL